MGEKIESHFPSIENKCKQEDGEMKRDREDNCPQGVTATVFSFLTCQLGFSCFITGTTTNASRSQGSCAEQIWLFQVSAGQQKIYGEKQYLQYIKKKKRSSYSHCTCVPVSEQHPRSRLPKTFTPSLKSELPVKSKQENKLQIDPAFERNLFSQHSR